MARLVLSAGSERARPAVTRIVLYQPEIPPNTGNVARTCAATGTPLHLIEPLGFDLSNRHTQRAGLDYWRHLSLHVHPNWDDFAAKQQGAVFAFLETSGAEMYHTIPTPQPGDTVALVFGKETTGIPPEILARYPSQVYRIPMEREIRSLNLSNSVALVLFDLLRRSGFRDLA